MRTALFGVLFIGAFFLPKEILWAKDNNFEKTWKSVKEEALFLKANKEEVKAYEVDFERSKKHWEPQVYSIAQSFVTNDPGISMFSLLSQRSIKQEDFFADKLNHPDTSLITKASLGLNFSFYEGGMKEAISKAQENVWKSKETEYKQNILSMYAEFAKNYFLIEVAKLHDEDLKKVEKQLDQLLQKYKLGDKSNMLGHSGLLGLQSLKLRFNALFDENNAKMSAYEKAINELSHHEFVKNTKNLTEEELLKAFNEYFPKENAQYVETLQVQAHELNAKAAEAAIDAEKSRHLPRLGAFVESYAFSGDRKMGTGYSGGLYLNWNLYSGNDYKATEEAIMKSKSAHFYAKAISLQEKITFDGLTSSEVALLKTVKTLSDAQKLLDKQNEVASNLFKNGMINALQLVEVISRRVDLIHSKNEVYTKILETKSKLMGLQKTSLAIIEE